MAVWIYSPRGDADKCCECQENVCDTCFCDLTLDTAGGDAGYNHTFDVTGDFPTARDIYVDFESYTIKDRLIIKADGVEKYNSGCIGAHVTPTVNIPAFTTSAQVIVEADCDGGTGTLWVLSITCA